MGTAGETLYIPKKICLRVASHELEVQQSEHMRQVSCVDQVAHEEQCRSSREIGHGIPVMEKKDLSGTEMKTQADNNEDVEGAKIHCRIVENEGNRTIRGMSETRCKTESGEQIHPKFSVLHGTHCRYSV